MKQDQLPVLEEFVTVQGEGRNVGVPYYFIRVGGCPLRCNFCDSEYTWKVDKGSITSVKEVVDKAWRACNEHNIEWVSITGGEPLLYPRQILTIIEGLRSLSGGRIKVHIETSGRFYDKDVHKECEIYSVDAKTPCTGEMTDGFFKGIESIRQQDQVKCLIDSDLDLDYAHSVNTALDSRAPMVLQPFNVSIVTDSTANMTLLMKEGRHQMKPSITQIRRNLSVALKWLLETYHRRCAQGERWHNVIITPQIHVIAFGNEPNT